MLLSKIFKGTDVKVNNDIDIKYITFDSRKVEKDYMFVAINGFEQDGHKYINNAISKGATAVLIDESRYDEFKDLDVEVLTTKSTRFIMGKLAINFYDDPSKEFKLIGITGTKGKTTTSFMVKKILEDSGKKTGLVGTVACYLGDKKIMDSDRTTPEALELQGMFRQMANEGCEYVVMEVSSQSLKLGRVDGCHFDLGLFTNLTEDHISPHEHASMEEYFECKCKLFDMTNTGIVNADDEKAMELMDLKPNCKFSTYSIKNESDKKATNINITNELTTFNVNLYGKEELINVSIPGEFTVYNALGAISICEKLGIESKYILSGLKEVRVPGRSELVDNDKGLTIMIDYAHSEDSLKNILTAVKLYTKGRIICVFGSAGDRDSIKRPKMGRVSGKLADYTIITTDNPKYDDPEMIANEIAKGTKEVTDQYKVIVDRKEAIEYALKMAKPGDIVVLAGKGHETYQLIGNEKVPFSEKEIVKEILEKM
jgi:UDP-N-acetylmuramoyl-L-alanyl-D-glutamate--2,6-diaminopimelate ligase